MPCQDVSVEKHSLGMHAQGIYGVLQGPERDTHGSSSQSQATESPSVTVKCISRSLLSSGVIGMRRGEFSYL